MSARIAALMASCSSQDKSDAELDPLMTGRLERVEADGSLIVELPVLGLQNVAWLEAGGNGGITLQHGDQLLVARLHGGTLIVALGRVGRYSPPAAELTIETASTLSLKCGASSIDLRADGKVMIRGEDVLVRAKGTQRIRAGTVAIN